MQETCNKDTLLYQLVSGLHASISCHVAMNFIENEKQTPNHAMFQRTVSLHPERVKNLYFIYALILKAVNKAEPQLIQALRNR